MGSYVVVEGEVSVLGGSGEKEKGADGEMRRRKVTSISKPRRRVVECVVWRWERRFERLERGHSRTGRPSLSRQKERTVAEGCGDLS